VRLEERWNPLNGYVLFAVGMVGLFVYAVTHIRWQEAAVGPTARQAADLKAVESPLSMFFPEEHEKATTLPSDLTAEQPPQRLISIAVYGGRDLDELRLRAVRHHVYLSLKLLGPFLDEFRTRNTPEGPSTIPAVLYANCNRLQRAFLVTAHDMRLVAGEAPVVKLTVKENHNADAREWVIENPLRVLRYTERGVEQAEVPVAGKRRGRGSSRPSLLLEELNAEKISEDAKAKSLAFVEPGPLLHWQKERPVRQGYTPSAAPSLSACGFIAVLSGRQFVESSWVFARISNLRYDDVDPSYARSLGLYLYSPRAGFIGLLGIDDRGEDPLPESGMKVDVARDMLKSGGALTHIDARIPEAILIPSENVYWLRNDSEPLKSVVLDDEPDVIEYWTVEPGSE